MTHLTHPVSVLTTGLPEGGLGLAGRAGLVALLLLTASAGWWVARRRAARFRPLPARHPHGASAEPLALTGAELARTLGARATFVQFSSATCASCPQVRRVLGDLAATETGVVHVDLGSEDHMELVRRFKVFRTPTVLLLDARGRVHSRTSGPLTAERARAALLGLDPTPVPATPLITRSIDA
ncbi:MAG: thioredoxin family protein [Cellulomonas sp.]